MPLSNDQSILEFTGERFTPECVREIWYEHWHRYAFTLPLAAGRDVIDVASGEGYGTDLLASVANRVHGYDIDEASIRHARKRYAARPNSHYQVASATALPLQDKSVGLIASFETLEHLGEQAEMLEEFSRVLADDGLLVISTPDKLTYSDKTGYNNPDHVKELYRNEFVDLLQQQFSEVLLFGQKMMFSSAIWSLLEEPEPRFRIHHHEGQAIKGQNSLAFEPLYYVAVCSKQAISVADQSKLSNLDLLTDAKEAMYNHYNDQVRQNIAFAHELMDKNKRLHVLEKQLAELKKRLDG